MSRSRHFSFFISAVLALAGCGSNDLDNNTAPSMQRRIAVNAELKIEMAYDGYHDHYTKTPSLTIDTEYTAIDTMRVSLILANNDSSACDSLMGQVALSFCYDTSYYWRSYQEYESYYRTLSIGCALDTGKKICLKASINHRTQSGYHRGGNGGDNGTSDASFHFEVEDIPYEETSDAILIDIPAIYISNAVKQLGGANNSYVSSLNNSANSNHKDSIISIQPAQPPTAHIYLKLTK